MEPRGPLSIHATKSVTSESWNRAEGGAVTDAVQPHDKMGHLSMMRRDGHACV